MDLEDLLAAQAWEEREEAQLEGFEAALFSLDECMETSCPPEEDTGDDSEREDAPEQIGLRPNGFAFFNQNMFTLYTEDTLVLPVQDSPDSFLSVIDQSNVKDCIIDGCFMREVDCSSKIAKYLFHIMCCTTDEKVRRMAYSSLIYLLTTCGNMPYIKQELSLVLINLGGRRNLLPEDTQHYRSLVISVPPRASPEAEAAQITVSQLQDVLQVLMQFLSEWLIKYKTYTAKDVDDLLFTFIIISLDCKVIGNALDVHIGACITHVLNLYSSEKEFRQRMRDTVKRIQKYCCDDLPSIVYLCEAYLCRTGRSRILCGVIAFHQLCHHLRLNPEHFVSDVQAQDIADLLYSYFQIFPKVTDAYDAYYIMKLVDLSLTLGFVQLDQKDNLKRICDLVDQKFERSQGSADDMTPTIAFQYMTGTLSKWNSHYTRLVSVGE